MRALNDVPTYVGRQKQFWRRGAVDIAFGSGEEDPG
jgi:hypothetical protein